MKSINDRVINVPIPDDDVIKTVSSLPRSMHNNGLVNIKVKRRLDFKKPEMEELQDPNQLLEAIIYLKQNHQCYKDIKIDENFFKVRTHNSDQNEVIEDKMIEEKVESESSSEDSENEEAKPTSDKFANVTCMIPEQPQTSVIVNDTNVSLQKKTKIASNVSVEIAPGQGKVPTNYMRDKDFDISSYPRHFPDGKYGLNCERPIRITPQQFFTQRLLNFDKRFSKDYGFLFVAQQFVERYSLERQINISMQKGKVVKTDGAVQVVQPKDAFNVFKHLKGTPSYWKTFRNDIFAMIEQFGPFHLFFTLSCAERNWPEISAAIFQANQHTVTLSTNPWDGEAQSILIDGIPLPEFKKTYKMSDFYINHVILITQMFDNRVKAFMKCFLKQGQYIEHYTFRIEFQVRGMPHVHGVIWFANDYVKKYLNPDGSFNLDNVDQLVDEWTTCSLDTASEKLNELVSKVNVHTHKEKYCQKQQSECRFKFPRLPSLKTIIAQELSDESDDEKEAKLKAAEKLLKKVKERIEQIDADEYEDLEAFLTDMNITMSDYLEALSISRRGSTIILRRSIKECFVNNYNETFMQAWRGNMDVQVVLDPYAVVSYVTDYLSKSDEDLTKLLRQALNETKNCNDMERLNHLKKTYFTHRQVCASEAVYRLFRGLKMRGSSVKTTFVSSGLPENRAAFLTKVDEENDDFTYDSDKSDSDEEETDNHENHGKFFYLVGREGKFKKATSIHDKYSRRPRNLKNVCLAQFSTTYEAVKKPKNVDFEDGISTEPSNITIFNSEEMLPKYISLSDGSFMKARQVQCVLRIHSSKKKDGHEFEYSEMLLFLPWFNERKELFPADIEKCKAKFLKNQKVILANRTSMLPYSSLVQEMQEYLESDQELRPTHIGDTIASNFEQENLEDEEDLEPCDETALPDEVDDSEAKGNISEGSKFKPIPQASDDEMRHDARMLSLEQRIVFDKLIEFCLLKSIGCNPAPMRLIAHGK